ncbi:MAG: response regulator [Porcipelethomonas sp.]
MKRKHEKDNTKNIRRVIKERTFIATAILVFITSLALYVAFYNINIITEKYCIQRLEEGVRSATNVLNSNIKGMQSRLTAVAQIIGNNREDTIDDLYNNKFSDIVKDTISEYRVKILYDGGIYDFDRNDYSYYGLSLKEEAKSGIHFSGRIRMENAETGEGEYGVRLFIPVVENGDVLAMVFGELYCDEIEEIFDSVDLFNYSADFFIVDRRTGDFIVDTKREPLLNMKNMNYSNIKEDEAEGVFQQNVLRGYKGNGVYESLDDEKRQYVSYTPTYIDSWSVLVSIPEEVALENLHQIKKVCWILIASESVVFAIYIIWQYRISKNNIEKAVLEERLIKAENAERAKTMFLSNMSHDIRTPMNAIIGYTTLATTNIDSREKVLDYHSKILSAGNHLLSLINDILDMSRIESGRVYIEETECSFPDMTRDLRSIIINQIHSKQLNLFIDTFDVVDEDIYCDKLHLNQVLLNLLSNAIKFTPSGGSVSMSITQKHGAPPGYGKYEFSVKDTGIGMSPEFAKHVFEPFERERTSTVSGIQGTGLGMAISKNIVDMMGGTIEVHSEQGKGTEFIINLEFRLVGEKKQIEVIKELDGLRALVVDDDFNICDSVTKMLSQIGMRAQWTMSGKEAVLHARQAAELADDFYAYVIDWQLPDLNGVEVARRIRKEVGDKVPIIILTAYDWSAIEDEAREAGVTAFCNKPIFLSTLRDTLLNIIGKVRKSEEKLVADTLDEVKGKRILLVEDNEINREIACELLTESDFVVETAEDGQVAVDKVSASEAGYYDIILMDIQMPNMNGYDAARAIRALDNHELSRIPIIAMTANAFVEDKQEAISAGMNTHISKPIDINALLDTITQFLK